MSDSDELRLRIAKAKGWYVHSQLGWVRENLAVDPPDWPRDIAAAWELVEEMGIGTKVMLEPEGWSCSRYIGDREIFYVRKTAPEAIARAYLAWKEAQP